MVGPVALALLAPPPPPSPFTRWFSYPYHVLITYKYVHVLQAAGKALSAFIHALYETNMAGLARYVWRKDTQPKVMALIPKIKAETEVSSRLAGHVSLMTHQCCLFVCLCCMCCLSVCLSVLSVVLVGAPVALYGGHETVRVWCSAW